MKKYYNIIEQKQTFKYIDDETTIISTDPRVSCFWDVLEQGEEIEFNDSNLPIKVKYKLKEDGSKYTHYLSLEDGIYKPDFNAIEASKLAMENRTKIQEAKQYLEDTDWIIVKINETKLLGEDIQPMLDKYSVEITKRQECRELV